MRILYMTANPQYARGRQIAAASSDQGGSADGKTVEQVAASIRKYEKIDLWPELRGVTDVLFDARVEGVVELEVVAEVRRGDVVRYVNTRRPDIVHFSGHGEKDEIVLGGDRAGELVPVEWLRGALAEKSIDVLVLNCCWSATLADQLKDEVDLIIGTTLPVGNKEAAEFSKTFYDELQRGATLGVAFRAATKNVGDGLYECAHRDESILERTLLVATDADTDIDTEKSGPPGLEEPTPAQEILNYSSKLEQIKTRLWTNLVWDVVMVVIAFQIAFIGFGVLNGAYEEHFDRLADVMPGRTPLPILFETMAKMHEHVEKWAPWLKWEPFAVFAILVGQPTARFVSYLWLFLGTRAAGRSLEVVGLRPEPSIRRELATGRIQTMFKRLEEYEQ